MVLYTQQTSVVKSARTRVKICGMTNIAEVAHAVDLGVDAIGVILHANSPRAITIAQASEIRKYVPAFVSFVGVFVNAKPQFIEQAIDQANIDLVQLHGDEENDFGADLTRPFIKAIRAKSPMQVEDDCRRFPAASALLLDPYVKGQHGGTGQSLNSNLWPHVSSTCSSSDKLDANNAVGAGGEENLSKTPPLILAGGLSPSNVASRIRELAPFAVDFNSGLEHSPGHKDPYLVERALEAVKSVDQESLDA